jgi:hypothetical protein
MIYYSTSSKSTLTDDYIYLQLTHSVQYLQFELLLFFNTYNFNIYLRRGEDEGAKCKISPCLSIHSRIQT